jgi:hypothetical protein
MCILFLSREDNRMRVFEKEVDKRMFAPKREEMTGG